MCFREAFKIGVLKQNLCRFIHFFDIGRMKTIPAALVYKSVFKSVHVVLIRTACGVKPRVSAIVERYKTVYRNIFWQERVEPLREEFTIKGIMVKMGKHLPGVHAGVCAPGPCNINFGLQ